MPTTYTKNKVHIYAWRQKNIDAVRAANRKSTHKYNAWKKIQKEFLNILLD
jgi:hypothetical protein